ncbi:MAG: hypothetical protein ACRCZQ_00155 [Bacteroidales bacterium]
MKNLAQLVQFFQIDYANNVGSSLQRLMLPQSLVTYAVEASTDAVPDEVLQDACAQITYYDDVPTLSGVPIYERLDGEPIPYYKLFEAYRDMKLSSPTRSIARLSEISEVPALQLTVLSRIWHWQLRAKPYDEYCERERSFIRQKEAEKLDNMLSKRGRDMLEMAFAYLDEHDMQLDPKTAIELIKTIAPITRVAAGMSKDAPVEAGFSSGRGGGSGTVVNVNTNQQVSSGSDGVHGMSASEVVEKTQKQAEDVGHLAGILNALNMSGAFDNQIMAQQGELEEPTFTEVEE